MRFNELVALFGAAVLLQVTPAWAQTQPAIADYSAYKPVDGRWTHALTATGSESRFLDSSGRAQLVLSCNRGTRRMTLAKAASGAAPYLQVWTTSMNRNLPASFVPATGLLSATLVANDPLLDAMAMSRGRIAVGVSGQAALIAPSWPEIARVSEECRL